MSRSPDLYEVIQAGVDLALSDVHTCMPGIVRSYDNATQLAEVQPTVKRRIKLDDGTETATEFPPIKNVPMVFPRSGKAFISFPVKAGDYALLVFSERSIDQWFEKGSVQDPIVNTVFQLGDAFAIAGIAPKDDKLTKTHADHIVIGHDDGDALAYFKKALICLGEESPSEFVALAQKTKDAIDGLKTDVSNLVTALGTHMHPSGMGPTGPPTSPFTPPGAIPSVAASKVKAV